MRYGFCRVLFGDSVVERYALIRQQIAASPDSTFGRPEPLICYAFGYENYDFLHSLGYTVHLVNTNPIVNWLGQQTERSPNPRGGINYGGTMWWHKIYAMRQAMRHVDALVYLDWDCRLAKPLPSYFWDRLDQGAAIQISLTQLHNVNAGWRPKRVPPSLAAEGACRRTVGEGAFIYCRDETIIDELLELYRQFPTWVDQQIITYWIDRKEGGGDARKGWKGLNHYKAAGYQPFCHGILHLQIPAEEIIFATRRPVISPVKKQELAERSAERVRRAKEAAEQQVEETEQASE